MMPLRRYNCSEFIGPNELLGEGSFGRIYKNEETGTGRALAIKVVKNPDGNKDARKEIKRMRRLHHPNVVRLIGIVPAGRGDDGGHSSTCLCHQVDITWMVMERAMNGNVLEYVRNRTGGLPAKDMTKIAHGVASGMFYLHNRAILIHRDLAARNILLDENLKPLIADFGLCEFYCDEHYYFDEEVVENPCPIRWMPPENLPVLSGPNQGDKYSRKGDVWAYGVFLFEMWSRCKFPFAGMSNLEVIEYVVEREYTVIKHSPIQARQWVVALLEHCFQFQKSDRPSFKRIITAIESGEPSLFNN